MNRLFSLMRKLRGANRGTAAIELALIAPILATLLVGVVDLSNGYSMKLLLEQAAQRAIEKVMNGQANTTTAAALKSEAASVAGVAESAVTVDFWLECNGTRATAYNTVCATGQAYARWMSVSITKSFSPMFAKEWAGANPDGTYTVVGRTGVRIQ